MRHFFFLFSFLFLWWGFQASATDCRGKYNFNAGWLLSVGDVPDAEEPGFADADWKKATLPYAFNEEEAFRLSIEQLTDTVVWYRKHFRLPADSRQKKVFIEFEGVRQGADFYINGKHIGLHENVLALRIDNDWDYKERNTDTPYQWNNRNFNANYGGIPKNVWLHLTDKLYQTLPLYSNLKTTGVYVYAEDIRVKSRKAVVHAESQVRNEHRKSKQVSYQVEIIDRDGTPVKTFSGEPVTVNPGQTANLKAEAEVDGLHFWSWGYGYLYIVRTSLWVDNKKVDEVSTRTGFRKTRFGDGKIWLNDRVLQMKGFAQRTSNEWPAVGMSVPAWLSDYSNGLMVEGNANLVRDAIIYNRNNPSILFYECGNESISRDEGLRKYWDEYSYPYHKEGAGPLYRGKDASDFNHNQDMLAVEHMRRWFDYWRERPGTGLRVSSGGVKIIFSDTNTHYRGEENYRRSGVTDAMRIPKDAFYAHQVMWDGWQIVEMAAPVANELDLFKAKGGDQPKRELRIVEIEFKENLWK